MQGPVMGIIGSGAGRDGSMKMFDGEGDEDMSTSELEDDPQTRAGMFPYIPSFFLTPGTRVRLTLIVQNGVHWYSRLLEYE